MTGGRQRARRGSGHELSRLLDEILVDAHGDGEQLEALRQAFEEHIDWPADGFVIGEPVEVLEVCWDGNVRRGLTARCRTEDGTEHTVGANEVVFPEGSEGARYVSAYRAWLGLDSAPALRPARTLPPKRHKAAEGDLDLSSPIELVVLAPKERGARCRIPGTAREITLRSKDVWDMVPGEIVMVRANKQWRHAGHPYLSGRMESHRLDVAVLDLLPLGLGEEWEWDPKEQYWGEEGEPIEEWAQPIIARGPRRSFEMQHVLPGEDPEDWDSDPIIEASERNMAGDRAGAVKLLAETLAADLRCLDAHAHLGNFDFEHRPEHAIRHYEVGVRIGELSLGEGFDGVLEWGRVLNRPFLRCLHGYGLCLWRLGRHAEAATVFERMLWLNPGDNQGIRFLVTQVRAGESWEEHRDDEP